MSVRKRNGQWVVDFYLGGRGGKRVRMTAPTKKLAEAIEREAKAAEFRGEVLPVASKGRTLRELIDDYRLLHGSGNRESTLRRNELVFAHLLEVMGNPMIGETTGQDFERYKIERLKLVKAGTVNLELRVAKSLFNQALNWGYLMRSPMRLVKAVRVDIVEPTFITVSEGERLIAAAEGPIRTYLALALHTGLRAGEMHALEWGDVRNADLRVKQAKGRRFRVVPLNSIALEALRKHPRHITSPLVFCRGDGRPWRNARKSLWNALEKAGLPKIRVHDLRHSFVSNLVAAGVDLATVKELAGHADITTTMGYAHVRQERLQAGVKALEG